MKFPRFTLQIFDKNNQLIHHYHGTKKGKVRGRLIRFFCDDCSVFIRVRYSSKYDNQGAYYTINDSLFAFKCFSEKDLFKEFK